MDAVLPLIGRDAPRARILFRSLERFFTGLGHVYVVMPPRDRTTVERTLRNSDISCVFVEETTVAPELSAFSHVRGWYQQQLLKLAIADWVDTPFYLTFDADVLATRAVGPDDLIRDGRALSHVDARDLHPDWYAATERLLGQPMVRRGISHNVTPAILSRDAVRRLTTAMTARVERGQYARGRAGLKQRLAHLRFGARTNWRTYLLAGLPWTEYALYYSFLEQQGIYEQFHLERDPCIYDTERSLWKNDAEAFREGWDPAPLFQGEGPPYFAILQSNMRIDSATIEARLAPFIS
ncbi:MAG: DUF6492 family protein [Myxococcota bacterium]